MRGFVAGAFAALATLAGVGMCRAAKHRNSALHAPNPPLDADDHAWADLVRRLQGPTSWCASCGQGTADDQLFCSDECQTEWMRSA